MNKFRSIFLAAAAAVATSAGAATACEPKNPQARNNQPQPPLSADLTTADKIPLAALAGVMKIIQGNYVDPKRTAAQDLLSAAGPLLSANAPGFRNALYDAARCMLRSLDAHSDFLDPIEKIRLQQSFVNQFTGIGVGLSKKKDGTVSIYSIVENSPAERAGLQKDDRVIQIDSRSPQSMTDEEVREVGKGAVGTFLKLKIERNRQLIDFSIKRETFSTPPVSHHMLPGNIAYIRLAIFSEGAGEFIKDALADMIQTASSHGTTLDGIILDLENDPGGLLKEVGHVAANFLPGGKSIYSRRGNDPNNNKNISVPSGQTPNKLPLVVLIGPHTASAAEILAAALQDYHVAHIIGKPSFGKDTDQTLYPLPSSIKVDGRMVPNPLADSLIKLTTDIIYAPNGLSHQGWGVIPDEEVAGQDGEKRERNYPNALPNPDRITTLPQSPLTCSMRANVGGLNPTTGWGLDLDELCAMAALGNIDAQRVVVRGPARKDQPGLNHS